MNFCSRIGTTLTLLAVAALLVIGKVSGACVDFQAEMAFPHCVDLDGSGSYALAWMTDADNIWLAIDVANPSATGFAGLGFSEAGGMKGSDLIAVARQADDGTLQVQDLWSVDFKAPTLDKEQNVVLVAPAPAGQPADALTPADVASRITEQPGRIRALLRRPIHSCDKQQDLSITPGLVQPVVYSWGENWPSYHGTTNRGNIQINFIPQNDDPVVKLPPKDTDPLPPNTFTMDLMMPNVSIPTAPTSYLCTHFQLPSDKRYQVIAQEALIRTPLLHHIILYSCYSPRPATGDLYDCLAMEPECSSFVLGWAPGQGYLEFPKEAGYAFGAGSETDPVPSWFSLQVHYNNPDGVQQEQPDTSGLRITYTDVMRPNDMGVLTLGQLNLVLAPQKSLVVAPATLCPSDCTARLQNPVNMLYVLLHMHQTGATISTRHIRGNTELEPLGRRRVWDFNFQAAAPIPLNTRELRPGDSLITQCTYKTLDRTSTTTYGEGTQDEMCFSFVLYYPKQNIEFCWNNKAFTNPETKEQISTALCASGAQLGAANGTAPPEQQFQQLMQAGALSNASWPSYSKYQDPLCTSYSVASATP